MYSLSFQYVNELFSYKSEIVMNIGFEPIILPIVSVSSPFEIIILVLIFQKRYSSPAQIWTADPYIISVVL